MGLGLFALVFYIDFPIVLLFCCVFGISFVCICCLFVFYVVLCADFTKGKYAVKSAC